MTPGLIRLGQSRIRRFAQSRIRRFGQSRIRMIAALLAAVVLGLAGSAAKAELRIDITRGRVEPMPIAITEFIGAAARETEMGRNIAQVVSADLERSGLFRPIDQRAFFKNRARFEMRPRFPNWRLLNAQALVNGKAQILPDGRARVEFRLWDVFSETQMVGVAVTAPPRYWRRIAHTIADAVYKRITGEDGYFNTRIIYIAESGPLKKRVKRLTIMDQDGANRRHLTDGADLVLTPRFSPQAQEITYLSYFHNRPRVYIFNIDTGRQEVLGDFPGMTFAPRFSPDGKKVAMSLATDGNSDLYEMDLRTRRVARLTNHPAIDTSPSYSPDRQRIVFNSDRGGTQQLYVMNSRGGDIRRISFGKGRYATPVWSPRGDLVAFTRIDAGRFYIGVMQPDGGGERLLADGYLVEGPTWAPNGRVLMFFRQERGDRRGRGGRTRLFSIDLTGHNEREIITPHDASDPAWSPVVP